MVSVGWTERWRAGKRLPALQGLCVLEEGGQSCHQPESPGSHVLVQGAVSGSALVLDTSGLVSGFDGGA